MKTLRLLFVDDEEFDLRGMRRILEVRQPLWDMTFVQSGADALARMADTSYDAIISDMRMPQMNGAELLNTVMARHPQTIRIALSGYADRDLILQCVTAAHQYLVKPCEASVLETVLMRISRMMADDRVKVIRELLARCPQLPSVPLVYSRLTEVLNNPYASVQEVGEILAQDAAMTTQLLKLVNSSFFGLGHKIGHPREAAMFLGIDTVRSLALTTHLFQPGFEPPPEVLSSPQLWSHSLACADAAQRIALDLGGNLLDANDAYFAGLLHDIGKLLLAANLPADYARAVGRAADGNIPLRQAEAEVFGANHAEVGGYFAGLLGLSPVVVDAIEHHHEPSRSLNPDSLALAAVHAGNVLVGRTRPVHPPLPASRLDVAFVAARDLAARIEGWRTALENPLGTPAQS